VVARRINIETTVGPTGSPRQVWCYNDVVPGPTVEIVESVPARAALAGNPSDGYGGAVLAVPVRAVSARVAVRPAERLVIGGRSFTTLDDLRGALRERDVSGLVALGVAAVEAFATHIGRPEPCSIDISTTIPESVGLAGSSAVVIATLRALAIRAGHPLPPPDVLAAIALAAEVDGLGIAAGLQDRVVQCHDRMMHMEFGGGDHEAVEPGGVWQLLVAYRLGAAAPSGATHQPLRERYDRGDPDVHEAMEALADQARRATAAMRDGDTASLGAAMERSFDIRRSIVQLDPAHVEMISLARAAGAAANFSGSGGSITVLATSDDIAISTRAALTRIGCRFLDVPIG
jgi:glucuronokinase